MVNHPARVSAGSPAVEVSARSPRWQSRVAESLGARFGHGGQDRVGRGQKDPADDPLWYDRAPEEAWSGSAAAALVNVTLLFALGTALSLCGLAIRQAGRLTARRAAI